MSDKTERMAEAYNPADILEQILPDKIWGFDRDAGSFRDAAASLLEPVELAPISSAEVAASATKEYRDQCSVDIDVTIMVPSGEDDDER